MRNGALSFVLLASFTCSLLGALFVRLRPDEAVKFNSLILEILGDVGRSLGYRGLAQLNDTLFVLSSLSWGMIFYAIFSLGATVITLGACATAVAIIRAERPERNLARGSEELSFRQFPLRTPRKFRLGRFLLSESPVSTVITDLPVPSSTVKRAYGVNSLMRSALLPLTFLNYGLTGRMTLIFTGAIAVFGVVALMLIHAVLLPSFKTQAFERARIAAVTVASDAKIPLTKRNVAALGDLMRKSVSRTGLAYILLVDDAGNVLAHSFDILPKQFLKRTSQERFPIEAQSTINLGDDPIYEAKFRIEGGRRNVIRVGVRKSDIDTELSNMITPVTQFIAAVVIAAICLAIFLIWRLTRPILRLVGAARRISIGDLNVVPPSVDENGEFGELSRALERMRSSVKAAMARL